jgi:hypothetical protein
MYKKLPHYSIQKSKLFSISSFFLKSVLSLLHWDFLFIYLSTIYSLPLSSSSLSPQAVYCWCVDVTAPELNRQGDESWRAAQFIPPSVRLSSSYSFRYPVTCSFSLPFLLFPHLFLFWLFDDLFSMWSPPPSLHRPIPSFSTVHVCYFLFKGLSQRLAWNGSKIGLKWVSWDRTYSYIICYA